MKNRNSISWISIALALATAIGIFFIPDYKLWFLLLLLANVVVSMVFCKHYEKQSLTVCRVLVGGLFIFSSFTKGVDPLGTKYKMLDYFASYHIEWLNEAAMVLAVLMTRLRLLRHRGQDDQLADVLQKPRHRCSAAAPDTER